MKIRKAVCSVSAFLLVMLSGDAATIEEMIGKAQKSPMPAFATATEALAKPSEKSIKKKSGGAVATLSFEELCSAAQNGDAAAQKAVAEFLRSRSRDVYAAMQSYGNLFFSVRKPVKGQDTAKTNYAVSLADFFKASCDTVKVPKRNFKVKTLDGSSYQVTSLQYLASQQTLGVKDGELSKSIPLAKLTELDRVFVQSALTDHLFESTQFKIEVKDGRSVEKFVEGAIVNVTSDAGSTRKGRISGVIAESTPRTITLINKGDFPLENLFVEYQSFAEQVILMFPKDFPEDYRIVGMVEIPVLMPGESKEIPVELPEIITSKAQSVTIGLEDYDVNFPPDVNSISQGRNNGIFVKVHRFTPYGERIEREYKSSGVPPSTKWEYMAPVNVDIR